MKKNESPRGSSLVDGSPWQRNETVRYSREEWDQYRPFIEGMYPLKGMNLKAISAFLKEDLGFVVNERQLKRKVKDWKLEKNVKSVEMRYIVRKTQQREALGKSTIFRVRGQPVDPSKIERWQKRCGEVQLNNGPASLVLSPAPSTPSDISYDTCQDARSPSPRSSSPYQRNTTLFRSIDFEVERSRHPPSAPQPQELDHTHPLNGFDADVFSNQGHDGLSEGHHSAFFTTTSPHTRNALNTDVFGGHGHEEPFKGQTPGLFTSPSSLARNTFEPDNFGDFRHEELFEVHDPIPVTTPPLPVPNTLGAEAFSNQGHGLPFEEKGPVPSSDCPLPDPTPRDEVTASPEPKRVSHVRNVSENLGARQIVDLALSQPTQVIHRKRYKQKAEFELIQRLNNSHYNQRWYHPATIDTAMRLAGILSLQGRYRSAELLFKQCVDRLEKAFGERNPRTLVASSPLSRVYVQQGQLAKGEKLSRLVYSRASEVFSPSNRDFLSIKIDFAYCIAILGDFTEAERLLREAMTIGGAVLPNDDPILLESTRYLAELLRIRGELDEAEKILLPYVDSRTSNRDNSDHLQTRASLGDEYAEFPKARQPLREVHEAQKQLIGSDHDQSLDTEKDPGLTSRDPGTFVEGEELLRDTINRSAKTLWMKHPLTVEKEAILAEFLNQPLRLMEAEKAALKVLTICGDVYCSKDEIICLSAMILGWSHRRQGRLEQALASITTAFEGYMRTRGPDHALTKECERRTIALAQEVDQRKSKNGASPRATDTGQVLRGVLGLTNYDLGLSSNDLVWTANLLALITSDISF